MKIGLALGGGGAKGFAHIGVLKALEEAGIRPHVVAGTSVGALVGAVYSAGRLQRLEERAAAISLTDIPMLLSPSWSFKGFFSGKNAIELLNDIIDIERIEDLPIPYAAVCSDLDRGVVVTLTSGPLKEAIRASISIPAVFTPVVRGDLLLVDGGLVDPVPVQAAKALGADVVIAIDLFGMPPENGSSLRRRGFADKLWPAGISNALSYLRALATKQPKNEAPTPRDRALSMIDVLERTLGTSQRILTEYRLRENPADLVICPEVYDVGLLDFHRGEPVIELGFNAGKAAVPEIEKLLKQQGSRFLGFTAS